MSLFAGVRVLDLSRMLAGPYGTMLMADLGAEVIKIEDPEGGDPMRRMGPPFLPGGESAYFLSINRNKKSVALDLTEPAGREVFLDLARVADVVWDNFRPGILERLGCQHARLHGLNPRLICCSISAFGQAGPYRDRPAFDLALQAMGGGMSVTGQGTLVDLSLLDGQVSLLTYLAQYFWTDGKVPGPMGSGHSSVVPYQALPAADGYLVVAVFAEKFWAGFCRAIDRPDLQHDPRFDRNAERVANRALLIPPLEALFRTRPVGEWLARLQQERVPAAPINRLDQVLGDPQVLQRQMVVTMDHPRHGPLPALGTPVKVDGRLELEVEPAPVLGQHTGELLRGLLGYPDERLAALRDAKVTA